MKRITIGRNPNCDIVYAQNMVSRNHAIINIYPSGKYEIISMGTNGTKVNGTLITNGQPYPLKRGDAVVFAGQYPLDWHQVPNPAGPLRWGIIIAGGVIALGLLTWGVIWAVNHDWSSDCDDPDPTEQPEITVSDITEENDSTSTAVPESSASGDNTTQSDEPAVSDNPSQADSTSAGRASRFFPRRNNQSTTGRNNKPDNKPDKNNNKPDNKPQTNTEPETEVEPDDWMH